MRDLLVLAIVALLAVTFFAAWLLFRYSPNTDE